MRDVLLYRYHRDGGGITVSPEIPNASYTTLHGLIADDGMELVKGDIRTPCIDVESTDGWNEEDAIEEEDALDEQI